MVRSEGEMALPSGDAAASTGLSVGPAIPPLAVSGLVVTRADLVTALRLYVPQLVDVTPLEGDRFLLSLRSQAPEQKGDIHG